MGPSLASTGPGWVVTQLSHLAAGPRRPVSSPAHGPESASHTCDLTALGTLGWCAPGAVDPTAWSWGGCELCLGSGVL